MNAKHLVSLVALVSLACGPIPVIEHPPKCGGPHFTASLSSVTLANDCASEARGGVADAAGACATGFACPSLCRQSSMQLAFASSTPAHVEIHAVRMIHPTSGKVLQNLTWRSPQQWSSEQYLAWDEMLPANNVVLRASYKLSAPTYNYPAESDARFGYQAPYKIEVDVAVGGELRTLQGEATREPEVAT